MVNNDPVAIEVPPVAAVYQLMVPELAVACKFKVPGPHLELSVVLVMVGNEFTVSVNVAVLMHPLALVPVTV